LLDRDDFVNFRFEFPVSLYTIGYRLALHLGLAKMATLDWFRRRLQPWRRANDKFGLSEAW